MHDGVPGKIHGQHVAGIIAGVMASATATLFSFGVVVGTTWVVGGAVVAITVDTEVFTIVIGTIIILALQPSSAKTMSATLKDKQILFFIFINPRFDPYITGPDCGKVPPQIRPYDLFRPILAQLESALSFRLYLSRPEGGS